MALPVQHVCFLPMRLGRVMICCVELPEKAEHLWRIVGRNPNSEQQVRGQPLQHLFTLSPECTTLAAVLGLDGQKQGNRNNHRGKAPQRRILRVPSNLGKVQVLQGNCQRLAPTLAGLHLSPEGVSSENYIVATFYAHTYSTCSIFNTDIVKLIATLVEAHRFELPRICFSTPQNSWLPAQALPTQREDRGLQPTSLVPGKASLHTTSRASTEAESIFISMSKKGSFTQAACSRSGQKNKPSTSGCPCLAWSHGSDHGVLASNSGMSRPRFFQPSARLDIHQLWSGEISPSSGCTPKGPHHQTVG